MVSDTEAGLWVSISLLYQQFGHYTRLSLQDMNRLGVSLTPVFSFVFQLVHACQSVLMQAQHAPALHIKRKGATTIVEQRQL